MKVAEVVAEALRFEGTEILFCYPHNALIEPAAERDIRVLVPRTERVAVNMADGYSRMHDGRRFGVVAVQFGPGVESSYAAVAQAYADASPVLLITSGYVRDRLGTAPNFEAAHSFATISKLALQVRTPEQVHAALRRAFIALRNGKPGPVVLEIPLDVMNAEVEWRELGDVRRIVTHPDPQDVQALYRALVEAERPVVLAGQGVLYGRATAQLVELAELLGVPVGTTLNGKSAFSEDHPLALGSGGRCSPPTLTGFLDRADRIVALGSSLTRSDYAVALPDAVAIAQVTNEWSDLGKDHVVDIAVCADVRATLSALLELARADCAEPRATGASAEIAQIKQRHRERWEPALASDEVPIDPYRALRELSAVVDASASVVSADAGWTRDAFGVLYEATTPHGFLGWGKSTQLGTSLGLVLGAKLARPDLLCVAVMGEGGFGMVGMDVETAAREGIPILVVVLNNSIIANYASHVPIAAARYGIAAISGDNARVAEALGVEAWRVERPDELRVVLTKAVAACGAGRPQLVEIICSEQPTPPTR